MLLYKSIGLLILRSVFKRSDITIDFQSNSYTVKEVEPEEFECVLDYIYLGRATLNTNNVERILCAAHRFQLDDLKRGCIDFLLLSLNPDNCLKVSVCIYCIKILLSF